MYFYFCKLDLSVFMKLFRFIFLLFFFSFKNLFAQTQMNSDDSLAHNNPEKVIKEWASKYNYAKNNSEKTLILLHTAYAFKKIKDYHHSLILLNKTEDLIKTLNDPYFKSIAYSRMASMFSGEVHYFKAKQLIKKALGESDLISDQDHSYYAKSFAYFTMVMIEHNERNFSEAIKSIEHCFDNFEKLSVKSQQKHKRFLMFTFINFGDTYTKAGQYEKAENVLLKCISMRSENFPKLEVYAYINLMDIKVDLNDNNTAIYYAGMALKKIGKKEYLQERDYIYNSLIECYKLDNNFEEVKKYEVIKHDNEKRILVKENESIRKSDIDNTVQSKSSTKWWYFVSILLLILIPVYYYKIKRNDQSQISAEIKKGNSVKENKSLTIPIDVENELLKKLKDFENTNKFTNPKMSVAMLASSLNTNVQYLSQVINKNKGKNFNAYINSLRIQYIIEELNSNKVLKTYKISHIANVAGFVSHSTFSKIFKQELGILPSEYIKAIQTES